MLSRVNLGIYRDRLFLVASYVLEIRATEHIPIVLLAGYYVASRLTCCCYKANAITVDMYRYYMHYLILLAYLTTQPYVATEVDTGRDEANRENTRVYGYPNPFS